MHTWYVRLDNEQTPPHGVVYLGDMMQLLPAFAGTPEPNKVYQCAALELLKAMDTASVGLIAVDPPYNGVKDEAWDNQWATDADFLEWLRAHLVEFRRVLKPNGSLYLFASPRMAARVEVLTGEYFNVLNSLIWRKEFSRHNGSDKDAIRVYFPQTERIVFAGHPDLDRTGLETIMNDQELFPEIRQYFADERQKIADLPFNEINHRMGTASNGGGMASNILNPWKINWAFPNKETYENLASVTGICQRPYEQLRQQYEELRREYEELRRPFNVSADVPYTDVWDFATVNTYPGKHPCEKPAAMMQHIVNASSRAGDLVLDCFCGSGATLAAAYHAGRQYIGCDMDANWVEVSRNRCVKDFGAKRKSSNTALDDLPLFANKVA